MPFFMTPFCRLLLRLTSLRFIPPTPSFPPAPAALAPALSTRFPHPLPPSASAASAAPLIWSLPSDDVDALEALDSLDSLDSLGGPGEAGPAGWVDDGYLGRGGGPGGGGGGRPRRPPGATARLPLPRADPEEGMKASCGNRARALHLPALWPSAVTRLTLRPPARPRGGS